MLHPVDLLPTQLTNQWRNRTQQQVIFTVFLAKQSNITATQVTIVKSVSTTCFTLSGSQRPYDLQFVTI